MRKLLIKIVGHDLGYNKPGLGPNRFGWLRAILPYHNLFHNAAVSHDVDGYGRGGDEWDRRMADERFLEDMFEVSNSVNELWWACFYYRMVRKYGRFFFKYR